MNRRVLGLRHIAGQQPYEAALAFALAMAAAWSLWGPARATGALGRVLARWQVQAADVMVIAGAALTLVGLAAVGVAVDAVHRVLARRVEQAGQFLMGASWRRMRRLRSRWGSPGSSGCWCTGRWRLRGYGGARRWGASRTAAVSSTRRRGVER